jgi:hypothetical protein
MAPWKRFEFTTPRRRPAITAPVPVELHFVVYHGLFFNWEERLLCPRSLLGPKIVKPIV